MMKGNCLFMSELQRKGKKRLFLSVGVGIVVLAALVTGALGMLRPATKSEAAANATWGNAVVQLNPQAKTLTLRYLVFNGPKNTPLMVHIHNGSCSGELLWMIPQDVQTDENGIASGSATFENVDAKEINPNWYVNVHNQTIPVANGKKLSIACGKVNVRRIVGYAQLAPNPSTIPPADPGLPGASDVSGNAIVQVNPRARTLTLYYQIFNAPKNTPLMVHIHEGSCGGTLRWMIPQDAQTDSNGNVFGKATFENVDAKEINLNWYVNVHNQLITATNGKKLSIACGQVNGHSIIGDAHLAPDPNAAPPAPQNTQSGK